MFKPTWITYTPDTDKIDEINLEAQVHNVIDFLVNKDTFSGIAHQEYLLTLPEAAHLVAVDGWFTGKFSDIAKPDGFNGRWHCPALKNVLSEKIKEIEKTLVEQVEAGKIKTEQTGLDSDERISPDRTLIHIDALMDLVTKNGISSGLILDGWKLAMGKIADDAIKQRLLRRNSPDTYMKVRAASEDKEQATIIQEQAAENWRLKQDLQAKDGEPAPSNNEPLALQKPIQRFPAQEDAILLAIANKGYDPQSLPKWQPGKAGVKSEIWSVLQERTGIFQSKGTFDKAWERLRADERIVDAPK